MNTPLAALLFLPDGTALGLYTEAIDLSALGRLTVKRASSIEFDNATQAWWVRLPKLGRVYCSPRGQPAWSGNSSTSKPRV